MWIFAMFDLPVTTKRKRKRYAQFRKLLIEQGFSMLQFSVYARYCASEEAAAPYQRQIKRELPPEGYIRLLLVTDRQFGKMQSYVGKMEQRAEKPPEQLMLF
jgi:CRISPR-associated protein Cas2